MQQYLELLKTIKEKGTHKPAARPNMPGTTSLFGYQLRHDLQKGFPLLTTKKMFWKGVVVELLWFLRGDTNIKFLVDNDVNIWNEDAYQYYMKIKKEMNVTARPLSLEQFIERIKLGEGANWYNGYTLGDCGYQYGKVWRNWKNKEVSSSHSDSERSYLLYRDIEVDQIKNVITSLKNNPESRRHIVTAIDPAHDNDLALYWCHAMFQFNCRIIPDETLYEMTGVMYDDWEHDKDISVQGLYNLGYPKYYLDCQLYQRSADVFLGVPFNIASYALLTHIIAKICNMIPGEFIHTFGDVHIYDNHMDAVNEQLKRTPGELPTVSVPHIGFDDHFDENIRITDFGDFDLENYNPQPSIKAELSTGLIK
jgi:thymidylate synthase